MGVGLGMGALGGLLAPGRLPAPTLAETASADALHLLNRLTWGIRPQDRANIAQLGNEGFIDWQLAPEKIADPLIDTFLKTQPILSMTVAQLANSANQPEGEYKIVLAVIWGRVYRAIFSERQLYERMVEFWSDHFNIPIPDFGPLKALDDREVIRKHALGHFRDLLFASAQSAAMIVYLNGDDNHKEHPNENYAREVMELHTLGVDGGYSEADVKAAARALTGWTARRQANPFHFDADAHDTDPKTILGVTFPAGRGIEDGLQFLDMLATHPATAHFITTKLCKRFVSETPDPGLIESATRVFTQTEGDIRAVLRHIFTSTAFMAAKGQKFRRPLDFAVAALRVTGATVNNPQPLLEGLQALGQIPFNWAQPNGYPDTAKAWMNTNGMLARWKASQALCMVPMPAEIGLTLALDKLIPSAPDAETLVTRAIQAITPAGFPDAERANLLTLANAAGGFAQETFAERRAAVVAALLASPTFQWV